MDDVNDQMLIAAMRRKIMREIEREQGGATPIVNNVYGGHLGGIAGQQPAQGADMGDDYDYLVDIARENVEPGDIDPSDPEGQRKFQRDGWFKRVHRYRVPKKKVTMERA